jgi:hypothetical protein
VALSGFAARMDAGRKNPQFDTNRQNWQNWIADLPGARWASGSEIRLFEIL